MGIMLVLVVLTFTISNLQALLWISSDWMVSTILPAVIVDLTNKERDTESLGTLKRNDVLDAAAKLKAEDMAQYEYFAHYSPTGVSPWHWFDAVSYDYVNAGENLAVHFTDSSDVVDAWMDSPTHRANIMNGNYTEIGVGTAKGEYKGFPTVFVVQLFGTPAAQASQSVETVAGAQAVQEPGITLETVSLSNESNASTTEDVAPATFEVIPPSPETETPEPIQTAETQANAETLDTTLETNVQEEQSPEESVVVYSDLATTSRDGVPATLDPSNTSEPHGPNVLTRSVTQPRLILQIIYGILASVVAVALILSIVIEWRRQNPIQIAYATAMLILMAFLFNIHTILTTGATIV